MEKWTKRSLLRIFLAASAVLLVPGTARAQAAVRAYADSTTYNVGSEVRLNVIFTAPEQWRPESLNLAATVRYAGEARPVGGSVVVVSGFAPTPAGPATGYHLLWTVPGDAMTGRYEVDLVARDSKSGQVVLTQPHAAFFAVHRKLVKIERIELDKTFYSSGDAVACRVTVKNLTHHELAGLRVEFSDRYWPWIAPRPEQSGAQIVPLSEALSLSSGAEQELWSPRAAVAQEVKQPTVRQFAVVVWDGERKNVLDLSFTPVVFVHSPGVDSPKPYAGPPGFPMQYLYPNLGAVNISSYRNFYGPHHNSSAIQFDTLHTMFASGSEAAVTFSVSNPTTKPWHGVTIRARLLAPGSAGFEDKIVAENVDLLLRAAPLQKLVTFTLPSGGAGIFRAQVEISDTSSQVLATNDLELAANPLPKSILIFCAHEDDEGAHAGIIHAAVENNIPIHLVYFTSGDAGSCDRYYQRSCGPEEALNFGALRMEEARASLAHLGVPRENIYFLGLPDGGSEQIWKNHVEPSNPYLSVMLASDHAPYEGLFHPNLPYARKSVVETAKEFIRKFQPEVIYTGHPDERHVDHRTNNWFVVKALQELLREGAVPPSLTLLVDQVYGPGPQTPAPYRYEKHLLHVSGEAAARAQETSWFYQSQNGNRSQGNLRSFDQLPRAEVHWRIVDWKDHEGWNEKD